VLLAAAAAWRGGRGLGLPDEAFSLLRGGSGAPKLPLRACRGSTGRPSSLARRVRQSQNNGIKGRTTAEKRLNRKTNAQRWRNASFQPPNVVEEFVSNEFIRMLRDGGPQAMKAEDLPELSLDWIGKTPAATAKNVVNALCFHRFGERVYVDRVHVVSDRARGVDFLVTLNLAAREILGSCNSINVRNFDRDTKELLELLKER